MNISNVKDTRLVIQPIHSVMVHEYVFEGPCRFGIGDELTLDFDRMNGAVGFDIFSLQSGYHDIPSYECCKYHDLKKKEWTQRQYPILLYAASP